MAKIITHYDNLKVARNAPTEVIRAAYKALSQKYHPDRNTDSLDTTHIMKIINNAYEVLSDPEKRREHDKWIEQQENVDNKDNDSYSEPIIKNSFQEEAKKRRRAQEQALREYTEEEKKEKSEKLNNRVLIFVLVCMFSILFIILLMPKKDSHFSELNSLESNSIFSRVESNENDIVYHPTSFDCTLAKSYSEITICSDPSLAQADRELAVILKDVKDKIGDQSKFNERLRRQWNYREKNYKDIACLEAWFDYQKKLYVSIIKDGDINASLVKLSILSQPLPNTGDSVNRKFSTGKYPLQIIVPNDGVHYFIKIEDFHTKQLLADYFIRSGEILNINLPIGNYKIKYAYGTKWYGVDNLFGENTNYVKIDQEFNFNSNGYKIELIRQINGNLKTLSLDKNDF